MRGTWWWTERRRIFERSTFKYLSRQDVNRTSQRDLISNYFCISHGPHVRTKIERIVIKPSSKNRLIKPMNSNEMLYTPNRKVLWKIEKAIEYKYSFFLVFPPTWTSGCGCVTCGGGAIQLSLKLEARSDRGASQWPSTSAPPGLLLNIGNHLIEESWLFQVTSRCDVSKFMTRTRWSTSLCSATVTGLLYISPLVDHR